MARACINCANPIGVGAQICPYCHLSPYDPTDTAPYKNLQQKDKGFDALGVCCAVGFPLMLWNPIVGACVVGVGFFSKLGRR